VVAPKGRTYGSKQSDQNNLLNLLQEGAVHIWNRFGPLFASDIRRQRINRMRGYRQWRWHLDEMYVKVNGEMRYLWRAVDHEGAILESYVTKTRDKSAALAFMKEALKRHGSPLEIVTDGLRSYPAAMQQLGNLDRQEMGRWKNNRAENSHLPFRRRERAMLAIPANEDATEVCLRPRQRPQSLQLRTPPH
jgi:transposase-like protein